ncbi:HSP20-like chaperone [Pyronema omphalodes]|nr:HSP20-like chaperone [Pyronema omphalodes]
MPSFPRFHSPKAEDTYRHGWVGQVFGGRIRFLTQLSTSASSTHRRAFSPTFDVHETEREYMSSKIEREIKGAKDGQGGLAEEKKKVAGDKTSAGQEDNKKEKVKERKYWVSERSVGEFSRCFSFPGLVDIDGVRASLEFGILKVVVPKMEKKIGRRIEIH